MDVNAAGTEKPFVPFCDYSGKSLLLSRRFRLDERPMDTLLTCISCWEKVVDKSIPVSCREISATVTSFWLWEGKIISCCARYEIQRMLENEAVRLDWAWPLVEVAPCRRESRFNWYIVSANIATTEACPGC